MQMEQTVDTTIQFSGLKSGVYHYDFTLNNRFFSEYKNEKILDANIVFDVKLEKKEQLMMFYFAYSGEVTTMCDRCLGEIKLPVEGEETLCVKFGDNEQSDDEDVVILPENDYKIDLAQWMYEYVAVSIPMQCVHPNDAEGNSTCDPEMTKYISEENDGEPTPTNEDDIDPRWEALKNLK